MRRARDVFLAGMAGLGLLGIIYSPLAAASPGKKGKLLSHCEGRQDGQTIYGGRGCAVRYAVPDPEKKWYASEVRVFGEAYGEYDRKETKFVISFIDREGNVYGSSEHLYDDYFGPSPAWATVKITPVQVPDLFWVVVDFMPNRGRGVYIGYVEKGSHSKLSDSDFNLYDIKEGFDFCIDVLVRNTVKGDFVPYDPSVFTKKADTAKAGEGSGGAKKEESDRVTVEYRGLDAIWGKSLMKLCDSVLVGYEEKFGLKSASPIMVVARVDAKAADSGIKTKQQGLIEWVIQERNELLPRSRGGRDPIVYLFCRELSRELIRQRLLRAAYAPEGLQDGLAAYLAGGGVAYLYETCGRELWPAPFNYLLEEGPNYVKEWIKEEPQTPDRRVAAVLEGIQSKEGDQRLADAVKTLFREPLPARDVMKKLKAILVDGGEKEWLDEVFPGDLVDPPLHWSLSKPDFQNPACFEGLVVRRHRTQVFLLYDDGDPAEARSLQEEEHALYLCPPDGSWRIKEIKVFCVRKGASKEGRLVLKLLDEGLTSFASVEVPYKSVSGRKIKWQSLGGFSEATVAGPFYLALDTGSGAEANIEIGIYRGEGKSHSAVIMPGSYIAPVPGGGDWMVRFYLESAEPLDRQGLDEAIHTLRKRIEGGGTR